MKKLKHFKIFWNYIKDDKLRLFLYILLVALSYLPALLSVYFWGVAVEALTARNFVNFLLYLSLYEGIYILFYTFLQIPRDYLYTYFEIKFTKNVSKDLYQKIDNWWINEIEIPTSADEIPADYNRDQVFSGQAFILSAINDIILLNGSDNYSEILKLFRKIKKEKTNGQECN